jgi:hypothetical protein
MFRFYIRHHHWQLMRPLLETAYCYAALKCGYYNSYFLNFERYNLNIKGRVAQSV